MRRVDSLGDNHEVRFSVLTGAVLDRGLDDTLQALVRQAAHELALPIALVSIVLKRTQFFRAHVGLPPDLALVRATDRDASFCQFVVRDGSRFEVHDARTDARVPKELVDRYGIQSYVGEPVRVGGVVVGSLCAIGTEPREFSDTDRVAMLRLAAKVSERLEELALRARATNRGLIAQAASPAFGEARNLLTMLKMNARMARVAAVDAAPIVELVRGMPAEVIESWPAFGCLTEAVSAAESFREIVNDIDEAAQRLVGTFESLQALVADVTSNVCVAEVIDVASNLALHSTKLVGGVAWEPVAPQLRVSTPRMVAVSVLSSALSLFADAIGSRQAGLRGRVRCSGGEVLIELFAEGVGRELVSRCAAELAKLIDHDPHVGVAHNDGSCISVRLSAAAMTR